MTYLYGGKILVVDLTTGRISTKPTLDYAQDFIGGRGINARLLYDAIGPDTDPLGPENVIAFGTGPLSGTAYPGCSRTDVMSKSPVTGLLGNANIGGDWAAELKYAGWDHVVLTGKAEHPVYVRIRNDVVELRDARELWGETTYETRRLIQEELDDPEAKILSIGPAGENLVSFATVHSSVGNAAARTGMGAVLGSKNVKALAVRGTKGVAVADPEAFLEACKAAHEQVKGADYYDEVHTLGVTQAEYAYVLSGIEAGGDGHGGIDFDPDGRTDYKAFWNKHGYKRTGCMGCPVHCMENYNVPGVGATVISCELYTQLTWEVQNDDMLLWYTLIRQCQEMGIDNTSMALTIQWLMELHDLGVIDASHTDGIPMVWGSKEAITAIMDRTIAGEGIGAVLARGMKATAEYFDDRIPSARRNGKSTYWYAMQVNNNPMYGINPRLTSMSLSYSIGRRSDCIQDLDMHQFDTVTAPVYPGWSKEDRAHAVEHEFELARELTGKERAGDPSTTEGKADIVHDMGVHTGISDMAGSCKWHTKWLFLYLMPEHYAAALSAGLGRAVSPKSLEEASLRIRNVERAIEVKMGRRRENDTIPEKEFSKPVSRGSMKGMYGVSRDDLERMKDEYYGLRGWDLKTGMPLHQTLVDCGLDDIARDLATLGLDPERLELQGHDAPGQGVEEAQAPAGSLPRQEA
jgi:aldehyde:ferredoxin oxidoreductase